MSSKSFLSYHIILTVKYRKAILENFDIASAISFTQKRCNISYIGIDKDHIHLIAHSTSKVAVCELIKDIKQFSTYWLWKAYPRQLRKLFWGRKKLFWNAGYFVNSLGNISMLQVEAYLEKQSLGRCIPPPNGTGFVPKP